MRTTKLATPVLVALTAAAGAALAGPVPNPGFDKLKTLAGRWETTMSDGKRATVSYEVVSAGSALLERIGGDHHADMEMITVYHPDGDRLVMTHYCSAQNQPRMAAPPTSGDANEIAFSFLDVTNLAAPDSGHMRGLVVRFVDADHFEQVWTFRAKGTEEKEVFRWSRVE